jgi:hypothetical protein
MQDMDVVQIIRLLLCLDNHEQRGGARPRQILVASCFTHAGLISISANVVGKMNPNCSQSSLAKLLCRAEVDANQ